MSDGNNRVYSAGARANNPGSIKALTGAVVEEGMSSASASASVISSSSSGSLGSPESILSAWVQVARESKALQERERELRSEALEAAMEMGSRGKLGVFSGGEVTLRFKKVKGQTERMGEIREELELERVKNRGRLGSLIGEKLQRVKEVEEEAAALRAQVEDLELGDRGRVLLEELAEEEASVAGQMAPELALKLVDLD